MFSDSLRKRAAIILSASMVLTMASPAAAAITDEDLPEGFAQSVAYHLQETADFPQSGSDLSQEAGDITQSEAYLSQETGADGTAQETGAEPSANGVILEDGFIETEAVQVSGVEEETASFEEEEEPEEDADGADQAFEAAGAVDDCLDDDPEGDEYGIVFENLDEVDPVVEVPDRVIRSQNEMVLGADGIITAESEKYIPIGHQSSDKYINYHTTAKQQSISADAVDGKRTYINETCWSFATMAALEASYNMKHGISNAKKENRGLKTSDGALDLSERALAYFTYFNDNRVTPDSMKTLEKDNNYLYIGSHEIETAKKATVPQAFALGGAPNYAMETLAMGIGPVIEEEVPYSTESQPTLNHEVVDGSHKFGTSYVLTEGRTIDMAQRDLVKQMILKYGGVSTSIYYVSKYINTMTVSGATTTYFHHPSAAQNHNILIVGWDDTVKPSCFINDVNTTGSEEAGAWLCKNSYGNEVSAKSNTGSAWMNEYGYFWVSYDSTDKLLVNNGVRRGFVFGMDTLEGEAQGVSENRTYQYDGAAFSKEITAGSSYANVYNVKSHGSAHEYLRSAVVKLSSPGSVYSVQVYADPQTEDPTSGTPLLESPVYGKVDAAGYYTLDLGKGIELAAEKNFSVVVDLYKANAGDDTPGIYSGVSGKYTMSVAKNKLIVPEDASSATVPAMYYCLNSTKAGHSLLYNTETKQWEDMFNNADSKNIHGNLRIKLRTVIKEAEEERIDPSYEVVDHFVRKKKDTGTVAQPIITLDDASEESGTTILYVGQTAIIRVEGATASDWFSKKDKIATVDSSGMVTAVKKGVTQISASVDGQKYTHRIMVRNPSFVITKMKLFLTNSAQLPINGKYQDVNYVSTKPDIVSVNSVTGEIKAVKSGSAMIKAVMGKTVLKCKVSVPKLLLAEKAITLAPEYPSWQVAFKNPQVNIKEATFESSDQAVVTVDEKGLITATGNGSAVVTVTVGGSFAKIKVTVLGI